MTTFSDLEKKAAADKLAIQTEVKTHRGLFIAVTVAALLIGFILAKIF